MNPEYYNKAHKRTVNNIGLLNQTKKRMEYISQFVESDMNSYSVLDLACGLGLLGECLSEETHYTGVDYSSEAISYAINNNSLNNRTYIYGDIFEFIQRLRPASFDCIVMAEIIEHLDIDSFDDLALRLAEISRKVYNRMVITVPVNMPNEPSHVRPKWTKEDIQDAVRFCGDISELHKFGEKMTWWLCVVERL